MCLVTSVRKTLTVVQGRIPLYAKNGVIVLRTCRRVSVGRKLLDRAERLAE